MPPQFTGYILFCYASSITNEGFQINLHVWTCDLFPVAMMSFSLHSCLSVVGAIHEHASDDLPHPVQEKLPH